MTTTNAPKHVSAAELSERVQDGTVGQFWNVLTDAYFTGESIPGSRRVPLDQVGREVAESRLAKGTPITVYCSGPTCPQSHAAADKLLALGFTNVTVFGGGLAEWKDAAYAIETLTAAAA